LSFLSRMFTPSKSVPDTVSVFNEPVDAGYSNTANLGRAALISTSPQGVEGTDPNGRYRILGN